MTVNELCTRFPEISLELCDEPTLVEFATTFGDLLAVAQKPSNCSTGHDPANHFLSEAGRSNHIFQLWSRDS